MEAPLGVTWSWVGQLRQAPYSYDWIDNWGHQSPCELPDPYPRVQVGDDIRIGTVADIATARRSALMRVQPTEQARQLFDLEQLTYGVEVISPTRSWLWAALGLRTSDSALRRIRQTALAWGDLVMMRRQLLNLAALAARDQRRGPNP